MNFRAPLKAPLTVFLGFFLSFILVLPASGADRRSAKKGEARSYAEALLDYGVSRSKDEKSNSTPLSGGFFLGVGYPAISLELGFLQSFPETTSRTATTKTEQTNGRLRLGLRTNIALLSFVDWFIRAGAEGQRLDKTVTTYKNFSTNTPESKEETSSALYGYPFIGTGLSIHFNDKVAVNFAISSALKDVTAIKRNDYDVSVGVQITQAL